MKEGANVLRVGQLCQRHAAEAVRVLALGPEEPWRAGLVVTQVLMTGLTLDMLASNGSEDPLSDFTAKYDGMCMPCAHPRLWDMARRCLFKGLSHAADVSLRKVLDPDCPLIPIGGPLGS